MTNESPEVVIISDIDKSLIPGILLLDSVSIIHERLTELSEIGTIQYETPLEEPAMTLAIEKYLDGGENEKNAVLEYFLSCLDGINRNMLTNLYFDYLETSKPFEPKIIESLQLLSHGNIHLATSEPDFIADAVTKYLNSKFGIQLVETTSTKCFWDIDNNLTNYTDSFKKPTYIAEDSNKRQFTEEILTQISQDTTVIGIGDHFKDDKPMADSIIENGGTFFWIQPNEEKQIEHKDTEGYIFVNNRDELGRYILESIPNIFT